MASEKNLITQARLSEVKFAESGLADNLFTHANASLSKAHGVILLNLPKPTLDANGNDISYYQDSHGDRVGYYYMRLTYNNTNYFAPVELTSLPGKDSLTGLAPDTSVTGIIPVIPGGTAWVTDFTQEDEQDLIFTNSGVLLPHTLLAHWETHSGGVYQVIPQITLDSAGHRVGNYIARVVVDGVELWLPCDTRLGGPIQPMRVAFPAITTRLGTNHNYSQMGRDDNQYGYFWWNAPTGGQLPYTFTWQFNTYQVTKISGKYTIDPLTGSGDWIDIPFSTTVETDLQPLGNPSQAYAKNKLPNQLTIRTDQSNDNLLPVVTLRGKYTNVVGTTYTNWLIHCVKDEDEKSFFGIEIEGADFNQTTFYTPIANDPVWVDGYYSPPGPPI